MKSFGGGGMANLMKQANQMQIKMKKAQEDLAQKEFTGSAGGSAVNVKVNGENKILSLTIDPEVMKSGDVEMLQDLILAAVNDANKTAKDETAKEMSKITGGMNIPGMF
ncbi:MAG: YbaB/EbfC family nucleoid-associated protein [Bdellovibrionaceae bacterium]|nr:YbaB/EbfC family nucleoid-associated protein [Pseudobdellovibrionaceae bacterium]